MDVWFWVWITLAALLIVAEMFTATFFLLPFGIGALAAALLELAGAGIAWQWASFITISAVMLILIRRFAKRVTGTPSIKTGVDRLLGASGIVTERIDPATARGQVRVEREEWRADSADGVAVPVGATVTVDRVEGTRLVVRPTDSGN